MYKYDTLEVGRTKGTGDWELCIHEENFITVFQIVWRTFKQLPDSRLNSP